jgi:hypothetical protein
LAEDKDERMDESNGEVDKPMGVDMDTDGAGTGIGGTTRTTISSQVATFSASTSKRSHRKRSGSVPNTYRCTATSSRFMIESSTSNRLQVLYSRDNQALVSFWQFYLPNAKFLLLRKGKSFWIYYALRRRIAERKPVIWYHEKTCFLFVNEGVYHMPKDFLPGYFKSVIWTLVDSDGARSTCHHI